MCGQLLADMGAEVQQWVRPAHQDALTDDPHWRAYTLGKGVHHIDWPAQTDVLLEALASADVLVESESEAFWQTLGLSDAVLGERFPRLIRVCITHFGRTGPKAAFAATDLISVAASGHLFASGAPDAAPLRISVPQAHAHASSDAAVAVLIALFERAVSGRGQILDISAQQSSTYPLLSRALDGAVGQPRVERAAFGSRIGQAYLKSQFAAADGEVVVLQGILPPLAAFMQRLMAWVSEESLIEARHLDREWGQAAMQLATGTLSAEDWAPVQDGIEHLVRSRSKATLMDEAVRRRLLVAPVLDLADVLDSGHLRARGFLRPSRTGRRLGPFARFGGSPLPLSENLPRRWQGPSTFRDVCAAETPGELPLSGLKVLDVFWVVAGPGATRMLADYGATVVHVESSRRLDMVRNVPPYVGGVAEPERAACHHSTNANKLNVCLDLGSEAGRAVLEDLIRWADVFTESFAPGVIERMGFGYEAVRALNPGIVMISSSLMGQTGPWRDYAGYGNSAAAVSGFHGLTGMPGRAPTGCFGPYTDFTSVRFNALAILAAVAHRRRSGEGQFIDMSQSEAALQFLAPACVEYLERGAIASAVGNRDRNMVPHGVFPTLGEDCWIALAVPTENEWRALCGLMERTDLAALTCPERRAREDEIEAMLAEWTSVRDAAELESALQAHRVPAHRVLATDELVDDPQLKARGHFIAVSHRDLDGCVVESSRLRFSRTRPKQPSEAPWFGIHNRQVLEDVLGYDAERVSELEAGGVLS
jgi:crotonobetainyl-CoA:carnitine CoA-transferase CaiB-like acyl-CoA transferase